LSWLGLVHDVDVVKHGVHGLNSRHGHIGLSGELDGGSQESLNFHRAAGLEILVHSAEAVGCGHLLNRLLLEVAREFAALRDGQLQEFVDNASHQLANTSFLH
jgi:hypothetical protein